jgi:ATP adenylyltransferase
MEYIKKIDKKNNECIFCTIPFQKSDKENLVIYRGKKNFIILNKYPYTNGHLMVVPYIHTSDSRDLCDATALEMWKLIHKCKVVLENTFFPDGFNIGLNIGRTAGAGIDQHIHMHIVPRWDGDSNFMSAIGKTKVISQSLSETYDSLFPGFSK